VRRIKWVWQNIAPKTSFIEKQNLSKRASSPKKQTRCNRPQKFGP
jgi:hypothetical protein